jgi:hypothetical protein
VVVTRVSPLPKARRYHRHLTSITINIFANHLAKEYWVTPATNITVNGRPARLDGLSTGMSVTVTFSPDGFTAANIEAGTAPR